MNALLKWPGGKRKMAARLAAQVAPHIAPGGRYIELFAGSGAVFFELEPERAVLVDACKPLMSFYEAIKREPTSFADEIDELLALPFGEETYNRIKSEWNGHDFGTRFAARLLYLNKLCFNGLFRLNRKLGFNAAWGKKKKLPQFPSRIEIHRVSDLLKKTKLYNTDYSVILRAAHKGDLIYVDPPYPNTYDSHAGGTFKDEDHRKLAKMLRSASERGVTIFSSNIDSPQIRDMYSSWMDIEAVEVNHVIGCTPDSRGSVSEVIMSAIAPFRDRRQLNLFTPSPAQVSDVVS